jgi:hypothetical protein
MAVDRRLASKSHSQHFLANLTWSSGNSQKKSSDNQNIAHVRGYY